MSLEICVLASGSAGNSTVVRSSKGVFLLDIGIGPRTADRRMAGTGVSVEQVRAVCLTHLDRDHFNPSWFNTLVRHQIPVVCHRRCVREVLATAGAHWPDGGNPTQAELRRRFEALLRPFDGTAFEILSGVRAHAIALPHDEAGSHGFLLEADDCRLGYATDLGTVPDALLNAFHNVDLLALESNYDPHMQRTSGRPAFLIERITGGAGHLSNGQALAAVKQLLDRCEACGGRLPRHIVLLHRSRDCNCPKLVQSLFARDPRIAPRLTLADQFQRTPWLPARGVPRPGEQLSLAF